ncbi:hypothetical protein FQR65_LT06209 [Abscondita terminalis]|nr:hypothetical protein FQR65_LT06209 [Abscondita terminalis]
MENREHEVWTRVIEVYRDRPHMWDKKNKQYFNRDMRQQTFEMMFEIFREFQQDIDLSHFKKKFENMRTSYARELKKVNASKQTGTGSDDVYKPSLWYYKLFDFFEETSEPSRRGIDTLDDVEEVIQNSGSNEPSGSHANSTQSLELNHPSSSQPDNSKRPNMPQQATTTRKKQMCIQNKQEKLFDTAQKLLTSSDDWQIIGQSIGLQLKDLSKHQLIFVQKIISDAIYYGRLEKLTEHSSINLGNPSAYFHTRNISTLPNNLYQFSSDLSSVTPIHTPSPQYQAYSSIPSPPPRHYQVQTSIPVKPPQYQTPSPVPSPQYQAQSSISIQSPLHKIQVCGSQCEDNSPNNDSDLTEFILFNNNNKQ